MQDVESGVDQATPFWAVFGDLMAGLLGAFVLVLVWVLGVQVDLATSLQQEKDRREAAEERRAALEEALSGPLASGRITLEEGRIGISGSVLFALNSDQLQPEGLELLSTLIEPLRIYLEQHNQMLMVSGFTDNLPIQKGNSHFADNWELSAQRALTVTRSLIDQGMPSSLVFAAAFGKEQPIAPNTDEAGRSQNRRVEMAPVPRLNTDQSRASSPNATLEKHEKESTQGTASND